MNDEQIESWMRRAIELAEKGRGQVEPNPMVGCLIVKDSVLIGQGYHEKYGEGHAEVNALRQCNESPAGSTVIVTLEPCCHHGKTPPCSQALIDAQVKEVIVGHQDPNPQVNGGGLAALQAAGIETRCGFLKYEIVLQNLGFFLRVRQQRPWVIAKYAMTMDGNIATATGSSKWISNDRCREHVHQLRGQVDAIIVGSQTVLADNPRLNARPPGPRMATKVVLDSRAQTPLDSNIVQSAPTEPAILFVNRSKSDSSKIASLEKAGVEVIACSSPYIDRIHHVLQELGKRGMTNVLLEGGSRLMGEFFQAGHIDELRTYIAPKLIGSGISPNTSPCFDTIADGPKMTLVEVQEIDGNVYTRSLSEDSLMNLN